MRELLLKRFLKVY